MEDHAAGVGEDMNYYTKALWQERNNPEEGRFLSGPVHLWDQGWKASEKIS